MKKDAVKIVREPLTWPFLTGDLVPRETDFADLRNDYAGDNMEQRQNIVLRYLENLPAGDATDVATMVSDIGRHYPFHGDGIEKFRPAIAALEDQGWVLAEGKRMRINKVGRVARRWLVAQMRSDK